MCSRLEQTTGFNQDFLLRPLVEIKENTLFAPPQFHLKPTHRQMIPSQLSLIPSHFCGQNQKLNIVSESFKHLLPLQIQNVFK